MSHALVAGAAAPTLDPRLPALLCQFGTDFTWENAINGTLFGEYFKYVDTVRDLLNADPAGRFRAIYSTPAEYFLAKLGNTSSLPLVVSDMFPYNDDTVGNNENGHNVWAGYFTSRPAFKVRMGLAVASSLPLPPPSLPLRGTYASQAPTCSRRASSRLSRGALPEASARRMRSLRWSAQWASCR